MSKIVNANSEVSPVTLQQIKGEIVANLGTPQANINAAQALAGRYFYAGNGKTEVLAQITGQLSERGKITAELACAEPGCNETHVREMSDWHQSVKCRTHAKAANKKLTAEEKAERALARAQAALAAARG